MATKKTDNHNLKAKLDLRRYFLRKYHAGGPIHVLDCCQGSGRIWHHLRGEFDVTSYWGVDQKRKAGRLRMDSSRILEQPGWPQNVVDIDTYGSPWRHWLAMLPNVTHPTTVFLTLGWTPTNRNLSGNSLGSQFIGLPEKTPQVIAAEVFKKIGVKSVLARCCVYGIKIVEAVEAVEAGARYFGVRLEPAKTNGEQLLPARRPKHSLTVGGSTNV